jgi:Protease inhibitor Inh
MRGMTCSCPANTRAPARLLAVLALATLPLAGCSGERLNGGLFASNAQDPVTTGSIRPQVDMTGRWVLVSPGRGQCNMNFAPNGGIAPEGGCPGNMFTSRNWNFEQSGLILRDHTGQPLAQLSAAGNARFDGRSITGEPITLHR